MVARTGAVPCYRPGSADHILATGQLDGVLNLFIAVVAKLAQGADELAMVCVQQSEGKGIRGDDGGRGRGAETGITTQRPLFQIGKEQ